MERLDYYVDYQNTDTLVEMKTARVREERALRERQNARNVLESVERYIDKGKSVDIDDVYEELSIFDWWKDKLTIANMKSMRGFLREALCLGYDGHVCFKVGASGCANGMWANKDKYGYDNDNVIYRSFTPDYVVWEACVDGVWTESWDNHKPVIKTKSELEKAIAEIKRG